MRSKKIAMMLAAAAAAVVVMPAVSASAAANSTPLQPQVGNSKYLVYTDNTGNCTSANISLHVRSASGATRTLTIGSALQKFLDEGGCNNVADFSLSGSTLTTELFTGFRNPSTVYWWDLAAGRHGSDPVPAKYNGLWAGSIPGGWLYTTKLQNTDNTKLIREGTGGKVTTYGSYATFNEVTTGTNGLLLVNSKGAASTVRYLAYGASKPKQLAAPPRDHNGLVCSAPTTRFASCVSISSDGDGNAVAYTEGITPLNGSATKTCKSCFGFRNGSFPDVTVSPRGVTAALPNGDLRTFRPDGTSITGPSHGLVAYPRHPVFTAFGKLIVVHPGGNTTEQTTVLSKQFILLKG